MKILSKISLMVAIVMVASMSFMSCVKEGPAGLDGKDGKDGINGLPGAAGQDGTAGCIKCHTNTQVSTAVTAQWERSAHGAGVLFVRNSTTCAGCHTSQGFREIITTNLDATAATINNPVGQNCYTCHKIHTAYTQADWALTATAPVKLRIKTTETIDYGKGNLCATCHQSRLPSPMPTVGGPDVTITSSTYGPHYAPQANILKGKGAFEFGTGYTNGPHANLTNNCIACHYVPASGIDGGGHMFNLGFVNATTLVESVITTSCTTCHPTAATLTTLMATTKTTLKALHDQLGARLIELNVLDAATGRIKTGTHTAARAGAFINYNMVKYDHSNGVHNFAYAKKLMENTLVALQ